MELLNSLGGGGGLGSGLSPSTSFGNKGGGKIDQGMLKALIQMLPLIQASVQQNQAMIAQTQGFVNSTIGMTLGGLGPSAQFLGGGMPMQGMGMGF